MNKIFIKYCSVFCVIISLLLTSCAGQHRTKSSVVDYLYPKSSDVFIEPSIPVLNIPLRVGVAFVPAGGSTSNRESYWKMQDAASALTEARKVQLLETVSAHFKQQKFIKEIHVIPTAYLTPAGSFPNLDQIQSMYGVDVIALVSYDQTQFTDENFLSLSYLTIVGAYMISGEKNDTSTLVDTVVYDIKSRKMLFRAPGTSQVKGRATPINLNKKLRNDSAEGFQIAFDQMIQNLDLQLVQFRQKLKDNPKEAEVVYAKGYSGGGGSIGVGVLLLLILIGFKKKQIKI